MFVKMEVLEAEDLMDAVFVNLAFKLFILLRIKVKIVTKYKLRVHLKI